MNSIKRSTNGITSIVAILMLCFGMSATHADDHGFKGELLDAWLTGRAETVLALNKHLNLYSITARVDQGTANLTGEVATSIDKALATELIAGIENIDSVNNELLINENLAASLEPKSVDSRRNFSKWIDDLTTTAVVRSKLVASREVNGLDIKVETRGNVVTLSGEVDSTAESALAEEITRNTGDVVGVNNNLLVTPVASN